MHARAHTHTTHTHTHTHTQFVYDIIHRALLTVCQYRIKTRTGFLPGAGSHAVASVRLYGSEANCGWRSLSANGGTLSRSGYTTYTLLHSQSRFLKAAIMLFLFEVANHKQPPLSDFHQPSPSKQFGPQRSRLTKMVVFPFPADLMFHYTR